MARTSFAVVCVDSRIDCLYPASGIMSRHGFKEIDYDGEKNVYCKENKELNIKEYIKFDCCFYTLIYSSWIKIIGDTEPYREYSFEHFGKNAKETDELYKVMWDIYDFFGDRFKRKSLYVYE